MADIKEQDEMVQPLTHEEVIEEEDEVMGLLAASFPWVVSLMFHMGVFLVLLFIIMMDIEPVDDDFPYEPGTTSRQLVATKYHVERKPVTRHKTQNEHAPVPQPEMKAPNLSQESDQRIDVVGVAGPSSGSGPVGISSGDIGIGTTFGGSFSGGAKNIVYVIDRSGSMIDTFDFLRREMINSIYMMDDSINFHLVFFSDGDTVEMRNKRLVPATRVNKKISVSFLKKEVTPFGMTNPVPALKRAFQVLQNTRKQGWLIYFLTDGAFDDDEAVLKTIDQLNKDRRVRIHTFLYGNRPPEAVKVMSRIAEENGGSYKYISHE